MALYSNLPSGGSTSFPALKDLITARVTPNDTLTTIVEKTGKGYIEFQVQGLSANGYVVLTVDGREFTIKYNDFLFRYGGSGIYFLPPIYFNESIKLQAKSGDYQYSALTNAIVVLL